MSETEWRPDFGPYLWTIERKGRSHGVVVEVAWNDYRMYARMPGETEWQTVAEWKHSEFEHADTLCDDILHEAFRR